MRRPTRPGHAIRTLLVLLTLPALLGERAPAGSEGSRRPDVIFLPPPQEVVEKMLELAEVKKGDVLYDLGCGDGRIVVTAAQKYGIRAVGIDIDGLPIATEKKTTIFPGDSSPKRW
jgi:methylase of polypeptide subunit release factors